LDLGQSKFQGRNFLSPSWFLRQFLGESIDSIDGNLLNNDLIS